MENDAVKGKFLLEQEIISLQDILEAFSAPLNEEQAWAICYQCGKFLDESLDRNITVEGANGVLLSNDGTVRLMFAIDTGSYFRVYCLLDCIMRSVYIDLCPDNLD